MDNRIELLQGKNVLTNILSSIWLGEFDKYEEIFNNLPDENKVEFPFHEHYERDEVKLWHENYFYIPGNYFVSPYFSSYRQSEKDEIRRRQDLLCLIGLYEKLGFYYPLEKSLYPDHFGCILTFINSIIGEQIKALEENDEQLYEQLVRLEMETSGQYIFSIKRSLREESDKKISHAFFKEFLNFFDEIMTEETLNVG